MKFLKKNSVNLLISICELVLGILLLINPTGFTTGIIIAFGAACLIFGIVQIVFYWRKPFAEAMSRFYLMKGLISVSLGLFCVCFSHWFLDTFVLLSFLYGILLLVAGFYKVQWSIDLLRQREKRWWMGAISAALTIIFSLLIIGNPFPSVNATWIFSGIALIIESVFDLTSLFLIRVFVNAKLPKHTKKETKAKAKKDSDLNVETNTETNTSANTDVDVNTETNTETKAKEEDLSNIPNSSKNPQNPVDNSDDSSFLQN